MRLPPLEGRSMTSRKRVKSLRVGRRLCPRPESALGHSGQTISAKIHLCPFWSKSRQTRARSDCPLCAKSGLKIIKPSQEMASFDRCRLPAALELGVALPARATSPPFYGGKQRSLFPHVQPSRGTLRRIVGTALLSTTPSSPPNVRAHYAAYTAFPIAVS